MVAGLTGSAFLLAVGICYAAIHHKGGVFVLVVGAASLMFFLVKVPVDRRRGKI